jgi:hypothetical protein
MIFHLGKGMAMGLFAMRALARRSRQVFAAALALLGATGALESKAGAAVVVTPPALAATYNDPIAQLPTFTTNPTATYSTTAPGNGGGNGVSFLQESVGSNPPFNFYGVTITTGDFSMPSNLPTISTSSPLQIALTKPITFNVINANVAPQLNLANTGNFTITGNGTLTYWMSETISPINNLDPTYSTAMVTATHSGAFQVSSLSGPQSTIPFNGASSATLQVFINFAWTPGAGGGTFSVDPGSGTAGFLATPEPSSLGLISLGASCLGGFVWLRRKWRGGAEPALAP